MQYAGTPGREDDMSKGSESGRAAMLRRGQSMSWDGAMVLGEEDVWLQGELRLWIQTSHSL